MGLIPVKRQATYYPSSEVLVPVWEWVPYGADPEGIDRVAQLVAGNDYGRFTMGTELTLAHAFGDSLLAARDQRWQ